MTTTGSAGVAMACGYCGRPCAAGVWIGHQVFHPECTRGPGFTQQHYVPPPLTEELLDEVERLNSPVVLSEWQKLVAERDALARDAAKPERWKHVKTGRIYEIVTHATDENTVRPVVVYRDPGGGDVWVRPEEQFYDGRFVKVDPASGASDDFGPTIPMVKPGEKHGR